MAALTANTSRSQHGAQTLRLPVKGGETLFQGAGVGRDATGYIRALVAGDKFVGFNQQKIDASAAANGEMTADVATGIFVSRLPLATDVVDAATHAKVYMSDDGTFTKTSTSNTLIGTIIGRESATIAIVRVVTDDIRDAVN